MHTTFHRCFSGRKVILVTHNKTDFATIFNAKEWNGGMIHQRRKMSQSKAKTEAASGIKHESRN
jgi:hypothetical protein